MKYTLIFQIVCTYSPHDDTPYIKDIVREYNSKEEAKLSLLLLSRLKIGEGRHLLYERFDEYGVMYSGPVLIGTK
jgi:hypothetical protein